tara:strand:- start:10174 stop:10599 length:426 start_codon:yes stop_codon:yes gene_type:complete
VSTLNIATIHQQLNQLNFIADKIRLVTVNVMPEDKRIKCTSNAGESFYNSYMNVIYKHADRYVLGFICQAPLLEHAIIKVGDQYFDPTQQQNENFEPYQFAVLTEFTIFDMMKHAKKNKDFPPDVDYLISKQKNFKNIIKQ